eukprot:gene32107-39654_t
MYGGQGGPTIGNYGGKGAHVTATFSVTPASIYFYNIGGSGGTNVGVSLSGGYNGGGKSGSNSGGGAGGGATDLRTNSTNRIMVAGGGGEVVEVPHNLQLVLLNVLAIQPVDWQVLDLLVALEMCMCMARAEEGISVEVVDNAPGAETVPPTRYPTSRPTIDLYSYHTSSQYENYLRHVINGTCPGWKTFTSAQLVLPFDDVYFSRIQ